MQRLSSEMAMAMAAALKCPRCESTNTKFCYYNNYNLSQPRHFCKACRRYWTHGGALRNVPVGGGSRKKSSRHLCSPSDAFVAKRRRSPRTPLLRPPPPPPPPPQSLTSPFAPCASDPVSVICPFDFGFGSLLSSTFSSDAYVESFQPSDGGIPAAMQSSANDDQSTTAVPENLLDSGFWVGGWPDLTMYTPSPGSGL